MYRLRAQVIPNRFGIALHVVSGVPGAKHDFKLFQESVRDVEALIADHAGEPMAILADKCYIGNVDSESVRLVTPHRSPPGRPLHQAQTREEQVLSRHGVVVENYFGRLAAEFKILVHRWAHENALYARVFMICCALANYDIRPHGGSSLRNVKGITYRRQLMLAVQDVRGDERTRADRIAQANHEASAMASGRQQTHQGEVSDEEPFSDGDIVE
jgi:hypothetical protein